MNDTFASKCDSNKLIWFYFLLSNSMEPLNSNESLESIMHDIHLSHLWNVHIKKLKRQTNSSCLCGFSFHIHHSSKIHLQLCFEYPLLISVLFWEHKVELNWIFTFYFLVFFLFVGNYFVFRACFQFKFFVIFLSSYFSISFRKRLTDLWCVIMPKML